MHGGVSLKVTMSSNNELDDGLIMDRKIKIWKHHWLPRKHPPQLLECPIEDFEDSTVDTPINLLSRQWIAELVNGLFTQEEVELKKKQIPLGRATSEDTLFWPHSSNGTTKSGQACLEWNLVHASATKGEDLALASLS